MHILYILSYVYYINMLRSLYIGVSMSQSVVGVSCCCRCLFVAGQETLLDAAFMS